MAVSELRKIDSIYWNVPTPGGMPTQRERGGGGGGGGGVG